MLKLDIPLFEAEETIPDLLARQARVRHDSPYAHFPDRSISYGALHAAAMRWARAFHAAGIRAGDHVATLMPNCADWLPVYYGALGAGAAVVALNARYKRQELAYTLGHSRSRILVTTNDFAEHVDYEPLLRDVLPDFEGQTPFDLRTEAAPDLRAVVMCGDGPAGPFPAAHAFLQRGESVDAADVAAEATLRRIDDTAAIIYTSGTTSNPKGCELSHRALQSCWSTFSNIVDLGADESVWLPMPFFHTGGIGPMTTILARGAALVSQPHFDPDILLELIERHRVNHLYSGFPQLSFPVLEHPRFDRIRFTHVRTMLNVGPAAMQMRAQQLLPENATLLNLFGMTEGSGIVTFTPIDAPLEIRARSSGLPPPHSDVRIVDPDTLATCADGVAGEIQFRGPGAFTRYYRDPDATNATIIEDGWVRTGDRGEIGPDGHLLFLGRIKDILKVGGENVGAVEIEAFLQTIPEIQLAQVIGMPDDRMGEVPIAFVERRPGMEIGQDEIIAACQGQLARWKIPRRILFVSEWPMSATKVQKFRLKELLASGSES
ncbi:class I adenylate-forming enzyme family protein [Sphingomonas colocasiae]|uniref:Acyl--CoA ligase n=1 Tax=Sphingomonas colocasiae TaxID=1848973 RepID=A0ABS7PWP9_9SPHN|nr:class I adenylate-forming enzyme family protein [Sphingomonas colocasiae]MBY8825633.1 acyl--CoA ligase [Sphingomonas colocasiae]